MADLKVKADASLEHCKKASLTAAKRNEVNTISILRVEADLGITVSSVLPFKASSGR